MQAVHPKRTADAQMTERILMFFITFTIYMILFDSDFSDDRAGSVSQEYTAPILHGIGSVEHLLGELE
jgi:hypothetical protein